MKRMTAQEIMRDLEKRPARFTEAERFMIKTALVYSKAALMSVALFTIIAVSVLLILGGRPR